MVCFPDGARNVLSKGSTPNVGSSELLFKNEIGVRFLGVKRPAGEADRPTSSSAKVQNK